MAFADALRALNAMKAEGVVEEYAVAGALAMVFWTDLVALYLLPGSRTPKRRERAAMLMELPSLNRTRLDDILSRYDLAP